MLHVQHYDVTYFKFLTMVFGFGRRKDKEEAIVDPSAWILENSISKVLLMSSKEVLYMAMLGYMFYHGMLI